LEQGTDLERGKGGSFKRSVLGELDPTDWILVEVTQLHGVVEHGPQALQINLNGGRVDLLGALRGIGLDVLRKDPVEDALGAGTEVFPELGHDALIAGQGRA